MNSERTIVTLLVHLRTKKEYYEEHAAVVGKNWQEIQRIGPWSSDEEFNAWRERRRSDFERYWFWPPWRYNDIVGHVRVYYDGGQRVVAEAYLPRKRISRQLKRKEFHPCGRIGDARVKQADNEGLRAAVTAAVDVAFRSLATRQPPLHLEYDPHFIECLDIAKLLTLPPA